MGLLLMPSIRGSLLDPLCFRIAALFALWLGLSQGAAAGRRKHSLVVADPEVSVLSAELSDQPFQQVHGVEC